MIDLAAQLPSDELDRFMAGVVRGRYHVLLGAGASVGGTSTDGRPLPSGRALAAEIQAAFSLPADATVDLRRVFAAALRRTTVTGQTIFDYLRDRFVGTSPPDWMVKTFLRLPWAQLWSLNIDDCVEQAGNSLTGAQARTIFSISWTERHRVPRQDRDETLLVHLHGKASKARTEGELVFDIGSYLGAATSQHRWHSIFGDTFPYEPFLVVGASLDTEIDLQAVLDRGRLGTTEHPSIIVLDKISEFQREEFERYGLTAVEAKAADFFDAVASLYPTYVQRVTHDESLEDGVVPQAVMRFLSQWTLHDLDQDVRPDPRHDFFTGHDPEWQDIVAELPMLRDVVPPIVASLMRELGPGESAIECLFGDPFTGKTTVLLSVYRSLLEGGFRPVLHVPEVAPDTDTAVMWLRHYPRTVFVIDRGGDFSRDIRDIYEKALGQGLPVRALLVDRATRTKDVDRALNGLPYASRQVGRKLTNREIDSLIAVLTKHRRLGILRPLDPRQRISHFLKYDREIFSSMSALEAGRGFADRIRAEFDAITGADARALLLTTCIAAALGHDLPMPVVRKAVGIDAMSVARLVADGELADLIALRRDNLRLRMRSMGHAVVTGCATREDLYDATSSLAVAIGPFVSPMAITARTQYYRLSRDLMGQQLLGEWLGDPNRVLTWYEEVEPAFEWNARFWEQRALAAASAGLFEPSFSWALEAVARHEDPYTMNTVGTVLMRRAVAEASTSRWPTDSFESALEYLARARDLERDDPSEYPFETFFVYVSRLVARVTSRDPALDEQLRSVWRMWRTRMLALPPGGQKRLEPTYRQALATWRSAGLAE